jgi:hypothetical protein
MADLETGPAYVEDPWEQGIVEILVSRAGAPEGAEDGHETDQDSNQSEDVPRRSLP